MVNGYIRDRKIGTNTEAACACVSACYTDTQICRSVGRVDIYIIMQPKTVCIVIASPLFGALGSYKENPKLNCTSHELGGNLESMKPHALFITS
jgi:hypothetical protein